MYVCGCLSTLHVVDEPSLVAWQLLVKQYMMINWLCLFPNQFLKKFSKSKITVNNSETYKLRRYTLQHIHKRIHVVVDCCNMWKDDVDVLNTIVFVVCLKR